MNDKDPVQRVIELAREVVDAAHALREKKTGAKEFFVKIGELDEAFDEYDALPKNQPGETQVERFEGWRVWRDAWFFSVVAPDGRNFDDPNGKGEWVEATIKMTNDEFDLDAWIELHGPDKASVLANFPVGLIGQSK